MPLTRRQFLQRLGLTVGMLPLLRVQLGCGDEDANNAPFVDSYPQYSFTGTPGPEGLFSHGVASGEPGADRMLLWTRVTPPSEGSSEGSLEVWWEIAEDVAFERRVNVGTFVTDASRDYTVKVDVDKLKAGQTYYYRFKALGRISPVGRTRTLPVGEVERLRFGVTSCSNYTKGYFHVYDKLADRADLAAVLHLGDYIYEYGGSSDVVKPGEATPGFRGDLEGREPDPPHEIISLDDYRRRLAQYRTDPHLQRAHQQHPFIVVWDDHETANNAWPGGAQNHDPEREGAWADRRAAAMQAYFEWLPVHDNDENRIWRTFRYGDLLDLIMLDTRQFGREEQSDEARKEAGRQLLGAEQEAWLIEQLKTSKATWRTLGQQVMMAHLQINASPLNIDQWDGYESARERLFDVIEAEQIDNLVVLTGDIHTSWANAITREPLQYDKVTGAGALGVEFVTPSVTSAALAGVNDAIFRLLDIHNPHIHWADLTQKGYLVLDLSAERAQSDWYHIPRIDTLTVEESFTIGFRTDAGAAHLIEQTEPLPPIEGAPALAPDYDPASSLDPSLMSATVG